MKRALISCLVLSATVFISQIAAAATVYQWTDADGVVHFSDEPPADSLTNATREINFDEFADTASSLEKYSIIEQADLMAEWRRQNSEDHQALKRLELEEKHMDQEMELNRLKAQQQLDENNRLRPHYFVFPQPLFDNNHRHDHVLEQPDPQERPTPRIPDDLPADPQTGKSGNFRVSGGN